MCATTYFISGTNGSPKSLADQHVVGGKGKGLNILSKISSITAPRYCITSTRAFAETITSNPNFSAALRNLDDLSCRWIKTRLSHKEHDIRMLDKKISEASCELSERITVSLLPAHFSSRLRAFVKQDLTPSGPLAVRSSAEGEDSKLSSFSGQYRSVLDVPLSELEYAMVEVWKSFFAENAIKARNNTSLYNLVLESLRNHKDPRSLNIQDVTSGLLLRHTSAAMAVIFMEMVNSVLAGTCYSINPSTKEPGTFFELSDKAYKVVDGDEDPLFRIFFDRTSSVSGNAPEGLPISWTYIERMKSQAQHVYAAARKEYSCPHVDTELAVDDDGNIVFLQVRPYLLSCLTPACEIDTSELQIIYAGFGDAVVSKPAIGRVVVGYCDDPSQKLLSKSDIQPGDILVTDKFNANYETSAHLLRGLATEFGGLSCHAANVASQHGISSLVGAHGVVGATLPYNGLMVTLDPNTRSIFLGEARMGSNSTITKRTRTVKRQRNKFWDYEINGVRYFGKPNSPLKGFQLEAYIRAFDHANETIKRIFKLKKPITIMLLDNESEGKTIISPCNEVNPVQNKIYKGPLDLVWQWFCERKQAASAFFDFAACFEPTEDNILRLFDVYSRMIGYFHIRGSAKIFCDYRLSEFLENKGVQAETNIFIRSLLFSRGRIFETIKCSEDIKELAAKAANNPVFRKNLPASSIFQELKRTGDRLLEDIIEYSQKYMIEHTEDWRHDPDTIAIKVINDLSSMLDSHQDHIPANDYIPLTELEEILSHINPGAETDYFLSLLNLVYEINFEHEYEHHAQIRHQWMVVNKLVEARPAIGRRITSFTLDELLKEFRS